MKIKALLFVVTLALSGLLVTSAHDIGYPHGDGSASKDLSSALSLIEVLIAQKADALSSRPALQSAIADNLLRVASPSPITATVVAPEWFARKTSPPVADSPNAAWPGTHPAIRSQPKDQLLASAALGPISAGINGLTVGALASIQSAAGNGSLMAASFAPFKPHTRYDSDNTYGYLQSDGMPDRTLMPNPMVGITSWQQQVPIFTSYFGGTTNPESDSASLGYKKPNVWKLPLVPIPSASPIAITSTTFTRGAIAIAANGIPIFNPHNNTGRLSYEIGELDTYGGHCGLADDYHYHIIPTHLSSIFGGPLGNDVPVAWSLDGYPYYGFLEPDGTAQLPLDANGGHSHGVWGYHYHAPGTTSVDATHPYGSPASPYAQTAFYGTVVNYSSQVDGQPEVGVIRSSGTGGYTAVPVSGAVITAFMNPVAFSTDGSGNFSLNASGTPSPDQYLMRYTVSGTTYDLCWKINRTINPPTVTVTWRLPTISPTTLTYANVNNRLTPYTTAAWSEKKLPDTSQTLNVAAAPQSQDSNYIINPQSFTDNGDGTITDNVTGLMWQKVDNGESLWPTAVNNAAGTTTGGYTDWRLPTPAELQSIQNYNNNQPALDTTYFTSAPITLANCTTTKGSTTVTCASTAQLSSAVSITGTNISAGTKVSSVTNSTAFVLSAPATGSGSSLTLTGQGGDYWWTSDPYYSSTTNVWCVNAGGGVGPKPLTGTTATLSAGGTYRYCARYVRGTKPTNGHNYLNNNDGTITDTDTGLMWTQVPAAAANWNTALSSATSLTTGGYSDWRLPNVKEMGTLTDYTLTSATTATAILPSIDRLMFGKTLTNCKTTAGSTTITCDDTTGLLVGMPLVDYVDVSGTYIPSTTPPTLASVGTGTFTVNSSTGINTGSGLTLKALVPPTAYWTSSIVDSGTLTQAWLVETGINNSVPAGSGPTRNAQGIISYEIFASTYPFFAVRNTSVAMQIAVQQPAGTSLTDGVSVVSYGNVNVGSTSTKTFVILNNGSTTLTITGVTIDGTNAANFTVTSVPATSIAAGGSTTMDVQFNASSTGTNLASLHIASSDTSVGAAFDIALSAIGYIPPPTISNTMTSPNTPTYVDGVYVTANLQAAAGATIASAQLSYSNGALTTGTVFRETMSSTPTASGSWDGTGADNAWTVTSLGGQGNVKQSTSANYGTGGTCGVNMSKGTANLTDTMIATTNGFTTSGTSGYVQFWVAASNLTSTNGWTFQLSTDGGTTWTTRVSELSGNNHAYQLYTYNLLPTELVSSLKMRFQFAGSSAANPPPQVDVDNITVVTTTAAAPVTVTMYDDGLHGDGVANDGVYGAAIPVQTAGTTVTYSITVTDSNGSSTSSATNGTYTVSNVTPPASFAATASRSGNDLIITWPSQAGISYSVQWSEDLLQWTNIPVGETSTWTDTGALGLASKRFYRVKR